MDQSILNSTKKILGIGPDDESFDLDIITHINSAFSILREDLGVGLTPFSISDDTTEWDAFVADTHRSFHLIKTYIYLKVRMLFDPPQTSYHLSAAQEQLKEAEWRISRQRESTDWIDPLPPLVVPSAYDPWEEA